MFYINLIIIPVVAAVVEVVLSPKLSVAEVVGTPNPTDVAAVVATGLDRFNVGCDVVAKLNAADVAAEVAAAVIPKREIER